MRKHKLSKLLLLMVGLSSLGLFLFAPKPAVAANPTTINFQGKIVNANGTNVTNGTYSFVFRIYNTASPTMTTACTSTTGCLWEETQASVTVTNGVFQVELGAACALTSSSCNNSTSGPINFSSTSALYLTLQYAGDTSGANGGFMSPTIHLTSVPFALNSDNATHVDAGTVTTLGVGDVNATAITIGNSTNSSVLFKTKYTAAALQVQNAGSNEILTIDGSATEANNFVRLGKPSTINGRVVFDNSSNANIITLVSGATVASGGSGYSLTLPLTGAAGTQCLQSTSGSTVAITTLIFNSCGGGGGTLASTYNSAATTGNNIVLQSAGGGVLIQDNATPLGAGVKLFAVQKSAGTVAYFDVTSTGVDVQSNFTGSAVNALTFDTSAATPHLKIFGSNGTSYADIYYDVGTTTAYFGASAGTAVLGSGTGPVSVTAGAGAAFTITGDANSTISTTSGSISITPTTSLSLQGGTTVTVDSSTTGAVSVGNGSSAKTVTIGNQTGATNLTLQSGSGNINLSPSAGNQVVYSQGAGSQLQLTASAATTADQLAITNAAGATSTTGVNGESINFNTAGSVASADNAGLRIDVTSNNSGATTTLEGLKIGDLSSAEANSTETGLYVGTGWDIGLDLHSGGIQMTALASNPAAPANGLLRVYAKTVAGRTVLKTIGSAGLDSPLQNALWQNNTVMWTPGGAVGTWVGASGAAVGTSAIVQPTTTNLYTSERRSTYAPASAAANIQNGIRSDAQFFHGNVAGNGGFFAAFHFGTSTWTAGDRMFVGFGVCTTACTTVNPSTLLNIAGFGIDAGDTAITFMHNDGSGTATKDAIAGQPALASNQGYDAYMYMKPNDSTIYYRLDDTNAATTIIDTSTTTDIIAVNTMVIAHAEMGTGTNTTIASSLLGINRIYVETDH